MSNAPRPVHHNNGSPSRADRLELAVAQLTELCQSLAFGQQAMMQQRQPQQQWLCSVCVTDSIQWESAHKTQIAEAQAMMRAETELYQAHPQDRPQPRNLNQILAEAFNAAPPVPNLACILVTFPDRGVCGVCPPHVMPQQGKPQLLIATANVNFSQLTQR